MIRFNEVAVAEYLQKLSFSLPEGVACKIITYSEDVKNLILDLMLGFYLPLQGEVYLFDKNLATVSPEELYGLRQRCGVVLSGGGLISNLKIRENLALPLMYHTLMPEEEMESRLADTLELTGLAAAHEHDFDKYFGQLPGPLHLYEKRLLALARALVFDPDLMIYDSPAEGISMEAAKKILEVTANFHKRKTGRASVYLTVNEDTLEPIKTPWVIKVAP
jgi:phospholipid/cholesterol/gamma-HCH transport system ATP-binding protein